MNNSILYTDARIPGYPDANAILCEGGLIKEIGSERLLEGRVRKRSLNRSWVYPGFNDTHLHILGLGEYLSFVQLYGIRSLPKTIDALSRALHSLPGTKKEWLRGMGWDQNLWDTTDYPDKTLLDAISDNTPICLSRVDGHAFWVNSIVLKMAGISSDTSDPAGGKIMRMNNSDEPSGILIDKAMDLVWKIIPAPDVARHTRLLSNAISYLNSYGITSAGDAGTSKMSFDILREQLRKNELTLRVNTMIPWREDPEGYKLADNGFIKANTFKVYLDGALGSRGAALTEPYTDDPGNTGLLLEDIEEVVQFVQKSNSYNYQVAIHAIGDRANNIALNAFEKSVKIFGKRIRNRVEHAQVINPEDITRFSELGVLPAIQPIHCTSDMRWIGNRLGMNRTKNAYPWAALRTAGSILLGGSDAPIESVNPLLGMYAASTRKNPDFSSQDGWYPSQKLTTSDALRAYTSWAAVGTYEEKLKGGVSAGYYADLVILSEELSVDPLSFLQTTVLNTIVNGKIVYEKS